MERKCKNCRYWDYFWYETHYQTCSHPKVAGINAGYDTAPSDGAQCSDVFCSIETGPDFGCIHFEIKEQ